MIPSAPARTAHAVGVGVKHLFLDSVIAAIFLCVSSLSLLAADSDSPDATDSDSLPLITPYNFDPADPGEYSRRGGKLAPGHVATGRVWNRPLPKLRRATKPLATLAAKPAPATPPQEPNELPASVAATSVPTLTEPASPNADLVPIEPIVAPDEPASLIEIVSATAQESLRPGDLLPAFEPRMQQLGKSVLGQPIVAHSFGTTGPKTLIFAAIHGDEPATEFVAKQLVEHLTKNPAAHYGRRVVIVPVANPDGLARRTRTNAREIDLNRNFPAKNFAVGKKGRYFGGEAPASEPETQLLIQLIEDWKPDRIVSLHAISRGKHGNNYDGPAERLAEAMNFHNQYAVLKSIGYPTPGSFGSWAGVDRQLPTITLEVPSDASGSTAWRENREALLAVIQAR
ncbi:MAG: M14 family murein peptide amidase A [Planctomycetaceae bacterium]